MDGNRKAKREGCKDSKREGRRDGKRKGKREGSRDGNRKGERGGSRDGNRKAKGEGCKDCKREGRRDGKRKGKRRAAGMARRRGSGRGRGRAAGMAFRDHIRMGKKDGSKDGKRDGERDGRGSVHCLQNNDRGWEGGQTRCNARPALVLPRRGLACLLHQHRMLQGTPIRLRTAPFFCFMVQGPWRLSGGLMVLGGPLAAFVRGLRCAACGSLSDARLLPRACRVSSDADSAAGRPWLRQRPSWLPGLQRHTTSNAHSTPATPTPLHTSNAHSSSARPWSPSVGQHAAHVLRAPSPPLAHRTPPSLEARPSGKGLRPQCVHTSCALFFCHDSPHMLL